MQTKILLIAALTLFATGCTSIHFDNGSQGVNARATSEQWHHNFALALYEGSSPVDLKANCNGGQWQSVETQLSFINGLAAGAANIVGPIWYPKTVKTSCAMTQVPMASE